METARFFLLIVLLLVAAYTDVAHRKIYNWLTFPIIGLGLGLAGGETVLNDNWGHFMPIILSLAISLVIYLIPFFLGWIGGGDLKLMVAISCLQGASPFGAGFMMHSIFNITLVGAVMAILLLIWKGTLLKGVAGSFKLLVHPMANKEEEQVLTIPYGIAISIGTFLTIFNLL